MSFDARNPMAIEDGIIPIESRLNRKPERVNEKPCVSNIWLGQKVAKLHQPKAIPMLPDPTSQSCG